jgi:hypothetical protein
MNEHTIAYLNDIAIHSISNGMMGLAQGKSSVGGGVGEFTKESHNLTQDFRNSDNASSYVKELQIEGYDNNQESRKLR